MALQQQPPAIGALPPFGGAQTNPLLAAFFKGLGTPPSSAPAQGASPAPPPPSSDGFSPSDDSQQEQQEVQSEIQQTQQEMSQLAQILAQGQQAAGSCGASGGCAAAPSSGGGGCAASPIGGGGGASPIGGGGGSCAAATCAAGSAAASSAGRGSSGSGSSYDGASSSVNQQTLLNNVKAVAQVAQKDGVDPKTAVATMLVESGGNNKAVGDGGTSFGLFQLHQGGELGNMSPAQADDPTANAEVAIGQMAQTQKSTGQSGGALAAAAQRPANPGQYAQTVDGKMGQASSLLQQAGV